MGKNLKADWCEKHNEILYYGAKCKYCESENEGVVKT